MSTFRDPATVQPSLSLRELEQTIERLRFVERLLEDGKLVYTVSAFVPVGQVIQVDEDISHYRYCVFHSEGDAQSMAQAYTLELVPLSDAPVKPVSDDLLRKVLGIPDTVAYQEVYDPRWWSLFRVLRMR